MKLNQQTAALALCTLLGVSVLAGCGRSGDFSELQPAVNKIEYTNLNDSGSRELLQELLSDQMQPCEGAIISISSPSVPAVFRAFSAVWTAFMTA